MANGNGLDYTFWCSEQPKPRFRIEYQRMVTPFKTFIIANICVPLNDSASYQLQIHNQRQQAKMLELITSSILSENQKKLSMIEKIYIFSPVTDSLKAILSYIKQYSKRAWL
jgi:hypothetical protein